MVKYVRFGEGKQNSFLRLVKSKTNLTWDKLAEHLDFCRNTIFFYLNETCKMSYETFIKLCKLANVDYTNFIISTVEINNRPKEITIPKLNLELAELIGAYLGDGHISPFNYEFSIVCGKIDKYYISNYVPKLIYKLFSLTSRIIPHQKDNGIKCGVYSKKISEFFRNKYNLKPGRKINPKIPSQIFKNNLLLKACIRGLIDTDGGVHRHHIHSIQLKFDNKSCSLILSLKKAFLQLGFNPRIKKHQKRNIFTLYLFGKEVERYFKEIGSSNPKNNIKFKEWGETGIMPRNTEILDKL